MGLVHGIAAAVLAARFPDLSKDAIWRHGKNHLSPATRRNPRTASSTEIDLDALRTAESQVPRANLVAQRARLHQTAQMALELADAKANISAKSRNYG